MKVNLAADLLLVHPPAYFDFRNNGEVYWPFLSSGGSEPITPLYENFPVGFKTLQRFLNNRTPKAGDCACPCFRAYGLFVSIYMGWLLLFEPLFSAMDHFDRRKKRLPEST